MVRLLQITLIPIIFVQHFQTIEKYFRIGMNDHKKYSLFHFDMNANISCKNKILR